MRSVPVLKKLHDVLITYSDLQIIHVLVGACISSHSVAHLDFILELIGDLFVNLSIQTDHFTAVILNASLLSTGEQGWQNGT